MRVRALLLVVAALTSVVSAAAAVPARKPATVQIKMDGMKFVPAEATAHPGDTIVWTNTDVVAHTVTSKTGLFDSQLIPPGGTWKYVAKKAGEFDYKCSYHLPMAGRFTVR